MLRCVGGARRTILSGHHSRPGVSSYSGTRRQPNFQFWACNWSLQRSALVQSLKTRDPSLWPLRNQVTIAPSARGLSTACDNNRPSARCIRHMTVGALYTN